jgi:hypothetical protein
MNEATEYGNSVGLGVDISLPQVDSSNSTRRADIIKAGYQRATLLSIALRARLGEAPAAGLMLGYMTAFVMVFVPYSDQQLQQQYGQQMRSLAEKMGLSDALIGGYLRTFRGSTLDPEILLNATVRFKDAVLHYLETTKLQTKALAPQLDVWSMGWTLGLATLVNAKGAAPDRVERSFEESRAYADALGIELPTLPQRGHDSPQDLAAASVYLNEDADGSILDQLSNRYGPRASALFFLAIKSTMALMLYGGNDQVARQLAEVIGEAGKAGGSPLRSILTAGF